jgi:hypothetical protein
MHQQRRMLRAYPLQWWHLRHRVAVMLDPCACLVEFDAGHAAGAADLGQAGAKPSTRRPPDPTVWFVAFFRSKENPIMSHLKTALVACLLFLAGCADGDSLPSQLPYEPNNTRVIAGDLDNAGGVVVNDYATPDGSACVNLDRVCVQPQTECGDNGSAIVLLDTDGTVADVICYPKEDVSVVAFEGEVPHTDNDTVLVLDDKDDGLDVAGDVTIDGNNVTLWGHGPDTSVIGGDLHIDKNNAVVSGVRIQGDVVIDKNNPSLVDCVIEGDLTIHGNNVSIALCEVWGTLSIDGNNAVLIGNEFRVSPEVTGKNLVCSSNRSFSDTNADHAVSDDELGGPIECSNKKDIKP